MKLRLEILKPGLEDVFGIRRCGLGRACGGKPIGWGRTLAGVGGESIFARRVCFHGGHRWGFIPIGVGVAALGTFRLGSGETNRRFPHRWCVSGEEGYRRGLGVRGLARGGSGTSAGNGSKIVVDMNLSPQWVAVLVEAGFDVASGGDASAWIVQWLGPFCRGGWGMGRYGRNLLYTAREGVKQR